MAEEYRGFSLTNIEELEQQAEENSDIIEQLIEGKGTGIHPIVAPDTDHEASGVKCTLTAGENLVFGEVCYQKSDGKIWKADADGGLVPILCMCLETITANNTGEFLLYGFVRDDTWNWTVGGVIYLSDTAGAITQTAPGDDYVAGIATHADRMLFNPIYLEEISAGISNIVEDTTPQLGGTLDLNSQTISIPMWEVEGHQGAWLGASFQRINTQPHWVFPAADNNAEVIMRGIYPSWATAMVNPKIVLRYFNSNSTDTWQVTTMVMANAVGEAEGDNGNVIYNASDSWSTVAIDTITEKELTCSGTVSPGDEVVVYISKTSTDTRDLRFLSAHLLRT